MSLKRRMGVAAALSAVLGCSAVFSRELETEAARNALDAVVQQAFGPQAEIFPLMQGRYIWAHTRPGFITQVVAVVPESTPRKVRGIAVVRVGTQVPATEIQGGANCLAVAFIHYRHPRNSALPFDIHVHQACFSDLVVKKARTDTVILSLESGGLSEIYWRNGRYHVRLIRRGD